MGKGNGQVGRHAVMPAWVEVIGEQGVADVAGFVVSNLDGRKLSESAKADVANGTKFFAANCVACR